MITQRRTQLILICALIVITIILGQYGRDLSKALDARWLTKYPSAWQIPFKDYISASMKWLVEDAAIGHQEKTLNMANGSFVRELCDSRTFCREDDVQAMHNSGLALGGTLENAVVVRGAEVLSPGGLRHSDEAVRHKMLDALGDLALAGVPLMARYSGVRAGHALTNKLLRALLEQESTWEEATFENGRKAPISYATPSYA